MTISYGATLLVTDSTKQKTIICDKKNNINLFLNLIIIIFVLIKNTFLKPISQKYQFFSNFKANCTLFDLNNVEPKPKYKLGQGVM